MKLPTLEKVETNLRHCLLLKADDLYFTLAEPFGEPLRSEFLGISVDGLADENLSPEEIASIDLGRFAIAQRIGDLHAMLLDRRLSLRRQHDPDTELARSDALDFLEHFLSTLPSVALGGLDLTSARNGEVRQIYSLAYAWLNLLETIEAAFEGEADSNLAVSDLALLSGLDTRTLRNRCGPDKLIRTSASRVFQSRNGASPAYVSLHALDAVDWLRSRKDFIISAIDTAWITTRLRRATPPQATRGLLLAAIINLGPLSDFTLSLGFTPEQARLWFDEGGALDPSIISALSKRLEL